MLAVRSDPLVAAAGSLMSRQSLPAAPVVLPLLARGVWRAPYLSVEGEPVYAAIDDRGRIVDWCVVTADMPAKAARMALRLRLDDVNPATPEAHVLPMRRRTPRDLAATKVRSDFLALLLTLLGFAA